jgi:hypothetical protein
MAWARSRVQASSRLSPRMMRRAGRAQISEGGEQGCEILLRGKAADGEDHGHRVTEPGMRGRIADMLARGGGVDPVGDDRHPPGPRGCVKGGRVGQRRRYQHQMRGIGSDQPRHGGAAPALDAARWRTGDGAHDVVADAIDALHAPRAATARPDGAMAVIARRDQQCRAGGAQIAAQRPCRAQLFPQARSAFAGQQGVMGHARHPLPAR